MTSGQEPALSADNRRTGSEPGSRYEYALYDLLLALGDPNPYEREAAIELLVEVGERAIPVIVRASQEDNQTARLAAAIAMGAIPDKRLLPQLKKLIEDADENVSYRAVMSLIAFPAGDIRDVILDTQYLKANRQLYLYLWSIAPPDDHIIRLAEVFDLMDENTRRQYVEGAIVETEGAIGNSIGKIIGQMRTFEDRLAVIHAVSDNEDWPSQQALIDILEEIQEGVLIVELLRLTPPEHISLTTIINRAGMLDDPQVESTLMRLLEIPQRLNDEKREAIFWALSQGSYSDVIPGLIQAWEDIETAAEGYALIAALGLRADKRALPLLEEILENPIPLSGEIWIPEETSWIDGEIGIRNIALWAIEQLTQDK